MLSLSAVLGETVDDGYFSLAKESARTDLDLPKPEDRAWAHGSLAELWLLTLASRRLSKGKRNHLRQQAVDEAQAIVDLLGNRTAFPVHSTRRQFKRYLDWWGSESFIALLGEAGIARQQLWQANGVVATAEQVVATLTGRWD